MSTKLGKKNGFKKILEILGLYKAYQNDLVHAKTFSKGTPALNKFLKNLNQGPVGEMKNAINTIWEFAKDPMTMGGSKIEDMIQNANKLWTSISGKGFLKKPLKGPNSIKDAGIAIKEKLLQYQKIVEAKK